MTRITILPPPTRRGLLVPADQVGHMLGSPEPITPFPLVESKVRHLLAHGSHPAMALGLHRKLWLPNSDDWIMEFLRLASHDAEWVAFWLREVLGLTDPAELKRMTLPHHSPPTVFDGVLSYDTHRAPATDMRHLAQRRVDEATQSLSIVRNLEPAIRVGLQTAVPGLGLAVGARPGTDTVLQRRLLKLYNPEASRVTALRREPETAFPAALDPELAADFLHHLRVRRVWALSMASLRASVAASAKLSPIWSPEVESPEIRLRPETPSILKVRMRWRPDIRWAVAASVVLLAGTAAGSALFRSPAAGNGRAGVTPTSAAVTPAFGGTAGSTISAAGDVASAPLPRTAPVLGWQPNTPARAPTPPSSSTRLNRVDRAGGRTALWLQGSDQLFYIVREGDTLWKITEDFLGDPFLYPTVANMSGIPGPDWIEPGDIVVMPILPELFWAQSGNNPPGVVIFSPL